MSEMGNRSSQGPRLQGPPIFAGQLPTIGGGPRDPEMPTLGEQRRSAAIQLAIQSGIHFEDGEQLIGTAKLVEEYLINEPSDEEPSPDTEGA